MTELPEGERLSYEELVEITANSGVLWGRLLDRIQYLEDELLENRRQMDSWADGVHKHIHAFEGQLSKVFQRTTKDHLTF